MSLYSVVVPVYNSEHTLGELYTRLEKVFRETLKEDFELILVDDGSKDRSYEIMTELREKDHRVRIIQMARNFGQHPAPEYHYPQMFRLMNCLYFRYLLKHHLPVSLPWMKNCLSSHYPLHLHL